MGGVVIEMNGIKVLGNEVITTRHGTKYVVMDEIKYSQLLKVDYKRMETIKETNLQKYPTLKVDWERLNPIFKKCAYQPFKSMETNLRPTVKNGGMFANIELLAMVGYSKHIRILKLRKPTEKYGRWQVIIENGWEVNHIDGDKYNCSNGNLEVIPQWLNGVDYKLKVLVERKKINHSTMDTIIKKYKNLAMKYKSNIEELNKEYEKEIKYILKGLQ